MKKNVKKTLSVVSLATMTGISTMAMPIINSGIIHAEEPAPVVEMKEKEAGEHTVKIVYVLEKYKDEAVKDIVNDNTKVAKVLDSKYTVYGADEAAKNDEKITFDKAITDETETKNTDNTKTYTINDKSELEKEYTAKTMPEYIKVIVTEKAEKADETSTGTETSTTDEGTGSDSVTTDENKPTKPEEGKHERVVEDNKEVKKDTDKKDEAVGDSTVSTETKDEAVGNSTVETKEENTQTVKVETKDEATQTEKTVEEKAKPEIIKKDKEKSKEVKEEMKKEKSKKEMPKTNAFLGAGLASTIAGIGATIFGVAKKRK